MDVTIAGRSLKEFGAWVQGPPTIGACEVNSGYYQGINRSSIQLLHNMRGSRSMTMSVVFYNNNIFERTRQQSEFDALFLGLEPVRIDFGDGYWYRAVLTKIKNKGTDHIAFTRTDYEFAVTRHRGEEVRADILHNGIVIWCQSNVAKTDCVITVTPPDSVLHYTAVRLNGSHQWDIPTSVGTIVLDGINKVYRIGDDVANSTITWTDFPYLQPGANTIELFLDNQWVEGMYGTVRYTPTFL